MGFVDRIVWKARPYVPFSWLAILCRMFNRLQGSVLDVGCGSGETMRWVNRSKRFHTAGVDIFLPSLKRCKESSTHEETVLCDVRWLPFRPKSFDIVLCTEVIEHLEKADALRVIMALEDIARKAVILSTPVGSYKQRALGDNPYWAHRSSWEPAELRGKGYKIRGIGLRNLGGEQGLTSRLPLLLKPLHYAIWSLATPLTYFLPKLGGHMLCTKDLS